MNPRPLKELLIILRDSIEVEQDGTMVCVGLCIQNSNNFFKKKIITAQERFILSEFIEGNMPKYEHDTDYAFEPYLLKPRIDWLNKEINKL